MNALAFLSELARLATDPVTVLLVVVGAQVGIVFGMLPGLTATMAMSLLTGLTFSLPASQAVAVLLGAYVGAITGGSRSAVLLNIPGTPAQAAVCLDGFPLAMQGRAAEAIGLSVTASTLGTLFGVAMLALFAPLLGQVALQFGTWEFFWLAVFGVVIAGSLTGGQDSLKGWMAGTLGLLLATVGQDGIHAYPRFTLGRVELQGGFALIPVLVGAYGMSEILTVLRRSERAVVHTRLDRVLPRFKEVFRHRWHILRSGLIGTFVGIIPGVGEDIASWVSYDVARRTSRSPQLFGKGSIEGLIAAETGDNACIGGACVPVLTLGVPGSAPAAVLLAALTIHGLKPGPLLVLQHPETVWQVVALFLLATLAVFVLSLTLVRPMVRILLIPREALMPVVYVLCVVGSFAISGRIFDVWVMLGFGLLGFALREAGFPVAPLVLGFILGPMADDNLRRGLSLGGGDPAPFFTRPISAILVSLIVFTVVGRTLVTSRVLRRGARGEASLSTGGG
ncbi:MAG: tripartite tricarboxylate transporter permease [Armatimonadota bacterium]|nr:tripartite tricarboxylate transporter permease [Armatimonadota bacterium]MDR5688801.1 tripartite tricarboxylate transporter permease [Armatimonadota bacterium]MDR7388690.1 tripartite tricarboxylate transporter permease [Armatimonadota bacterium]MDR7391122.1 tripartite tricarboxylate transporter permease [Armatimonadota bacterium]MDR7393355.1 tripartite tricarboxylate transporter permease [Armatimonadota bacterium]